MSVCILLLIFKVFIIDIQHLSTLVSSLSVFNISVLIAAAKNILSAFEKGEVCFKEVCQDWLLTDKKGFHDTIKNLKLKSFSDIGNVKRLQLVGKRQFSSQRGI